MHQQQVIASASLYFSEGASDKVYHAQIKPQGDGYVVNFQYGRRGSTLQSGSKTASPVPLEKAQAIFDKLVKEKTSKGYSPGIDGTPFAGTEKAGRATGISVQLLNAITREEAMRLLDDPKWYLQHKLDGERRVVIVSDEITGVNRKGLAVDLPKVIADESKQCFPPGTVVDGEQIGDKLYLFDILRYGDRDLTGSSYLARYAALQMAVPGRTNGDQPLIVVNTYRTASEKKEVFALLEKGGAEGVVFKRADAPYTAGRPDTGGDQLKFKFVETATVKVLGVNEGVRSVRMGLFDAQGHLCEVGNVTIPPNACVPSAGDLIEVRYLYAYPGGSLYQPVYIGPRTDLEDAAAVLDQLKYKTEHAHEMESAAA